MKRLWLFALLLLVCLSLVGCGGEKGLVGTWESVGSTGGKGDGPSRIVFKSKGACESGRAKGTYEILGEGRVKISLKEGNATTTIIGRYNPKTDELEIDGKRLRRVQ